MGYSFHKAGPDDYGTVLALIDSGRRIMRASGNPLQWPDGKPDPAKVEADIAAGNSWLVKEGDEAVATFAFVPGPDPTYARIDGAWLDDGPYCVIHRMAKLPGAAGIFNAVMDWCFGRCCNIRIDTHRDNAIMRHCIEAYGFVYCGIIWLEDGDERLAYQMHVPARQ
ncbi:MAG: N-acetyltransferase [Bacteroidales bacterium]|nr:N-acetyltransferase [Bacteroidales bacterium]